MGFPGWFRLGIRSTRKKKQKTKDDRLTCSALSVPVDFVSFSHWVTQHIDQVPFVNNSTSHPSAVGLSSLVVVAVVAVVAVVVVVVVVGGGGGVVESQKGRPTTNRRPAVEDDGK